MSSDVKRDKLVLGGLYKFPTTNRLLFNTNRFEDYLKRILEKLKLPMRSVINDMNEMKDRNIPDNKIVIRNREKKSFLSDKIWKALK